MFRKADRKNINDNGRKEMKKMKKIKQIFGQVKKTVKRAALVMTGMMYSPMTLCVVAYAADEKDGKETNNGGGNISAITKPLDNLKSIIIAVVGAIGVIILVKNVMEFAQAYQAQDTSTMNSALKGIVAGTMMALISTVLTILGIS